MWFDQVDPRDCRRRRNEKLIALNAIFISHQLFLIILTFSFL